MRIIVQITIEHRIFVTTYWRNFEDIISSFNATSRMRVHSNKRDALHPLTFDIIDLLIILKVILVTW